MEASRSFPADITSPRAARRFVGDLLGQPDGETRDLALVLTSELVTNAVVHARTQVDVRVEVERDRMRVEVADSDPRLPRPAAHVPDAPGGHGLFLVQALASTWGTDPCPGGKVVWFTLPNGHG